MQLSSSQFTSHRQSSPEDPPFQTSQDKQPVQTRVHNYIEDINMDSPPPRSAVDHTMEMRKTMVLDDEEEENDPDGFLLAEELNANEQQSLKVQPTPS